MNYDETRWAQILHDCGVRIGTAARFGIVFAAEVREERFSKGYNDLVEFVPTVLHETGMLESFVENMNYSAERIRAVWPTRFPTVDSARPFARNPEALANKVYGGRMGNTQEGDGWLFRGRGPGVTGRENYARVGALMGQDLVSMPHLLEQPRFGIEAFIYWWEDKIPDALLGDTAAIRRRVNGGQIGIDDVKSLKAKFIRATK